MNFMRFAKMRLEEKLVGKFSRQFWNINSDAKNSIYCTVLGDIRLLTKGA
jgi:hypothetical protein